MLFIKVFIWNKSFCKNARVFVRQREAGVSVRLQGEAFPGLESKELTLGTLQALLWEHTTQSYNGWKLIRLSYIDWIISVTWSTGCCQVQATGHPHVRADKIVWLESSQRSSLYLGLASQYEGYRAGQDCRHPPGNDSPPTCQHAQLGLWTWAGFLC